MKYIKDYLTESDTKSVCIHCPTLEEAQKINKLLKEAGARGFSEYDTASYWNTYKENYVALTGYSSTYADINYAKSYSLHIISASEFLEPVVNNSYSIF